MSDIDSLIDSSEYKQIINAISTDETKTIYFLELHITDICNSGCYFCNQRDLRQEKKEISFSRLKELILELKGIGLRGIRISGGGEPTTYSHLFDLIELLNKNNIALTRFDTNGILLTPKLSERLIDCELKQLHISLQAPTKYAWSSITGGKPQTFQKIINNIDYFLKLNVTNKTKVNVSFVIDEYTYLDLRKMINFSKQHSVNKIIHMLNSYEYSEYFRDVCLPEVLQQITNFPDVESACQLAIPFLYPENSNFMRRNTNNPNISTCFAPWTSLLVKANGNVFRCCEHQYKAGVIGNIYDSDFEDIWNGNMQKSNRRKAREYFFKNNSKNPPCPTRCAAKIGLYTIPGLESLLKTEMHHDE